MACSNVETLLYRAEETPKSFCNTSSQVWFRSLKTFLFAQTHSKSSHQDTVTMLKPPEGWKREPNLTAHLPMVSPKLPGPLHPSKCWQRHAFGKLSLSPWYDHQQDGSLAAHRGRIKKSLFFFSFLNRTHRNSIGQFWLYSPRVFIPVAIHGSKLLWLIFTLFRIQWYCTMGITAAY